MTHQTPSNRADRKSQVGGDTTEKLRRSWQRLLDLTLRNHFLNFRPGNPDYRDDLKGHKHAGFKGHPIISFVLNGDPLPQSEGIPSDDDFASHQETEDLPIVIDSDITQFATLLAGQKGVSLVVQGPPGPPTNFDRTSRDGKRMIINS